MATQVSGLNPADVLCLSHIYHYSISALSRLSFSTHFYMHFLVDRLPRYGSHCAPHSNAILHFQLADLDAPTNCEYGNERRSWLRELRYQTDYDTLPDSAPSNMQGPMHGPNSLRFYASGRCNPPDQPVIKYPQGINAQSRGSTSCQYYNHSN